MLWYIMNACVIMHNMIIQDEHGQNVVYGTYELMGRPDGGEVETELQAFLSPTMTFVTLTSLQKELMEEWWSWYGAQKTTLCT